MINPVKETMRWTLMAAMVAACSAAVIGSQATWAGSVLTREGKTFTGKVELKAGNQVVVTPADGVAVTVPLQDVVQLSMEDASTPDGPLDADAHLPAPWQQRDIGAVKEPGSGAQDKGVFSLHGAGG